MGSKVLVVDDDEDLNRALSTQVKRAGHHVRSAFSGADGLAQLATEPADAVLLDVQLGDMSGLEVLEVVRERYPGMVAILMTAEGSEDVAAMGLRLNADDYLRKPFRPAALFSALDRALAQQALRRENDLLRVQAAERAAELERELRAGARIHTALLAMQPLMMPRFSIEARCRPARELGGDFFDYGRLPDFGAFSVIGDVSGKGLPAALVMALARSLLRAALRRGSPARATSSVNSEIFADLEAMERFVTCFVCTIDAAGRRLRWSDAGHGYAVLLRAGEVLALNSPGGGPPLGIVPVCDYAQEETALQPGDEVLIFSDGLLERDELAGTGDHAALSARETIQLLLADAPAGAGAQTVLDLLRDDPNQPRRPARDDETVLVIRVTQ